MIAAVGHGLALSNSIAAVGHGLALSNSFAAVGHGLALANSNGAFRFQLLRSEVDGEPRESDIIHATNFFQKI